LRRHLDLEEQQQALGNPQATQPRRPGRIRRFLLPVLLLATVAIALTLLVCWHLMLPDSPRSTARDSPRSAPGSLTRSDVNAISNLCRRHTVHYAIDKLRRGEFGWFLRSSRVLFQQKIDRLVDDRDGTYRAYVVVYDKKESDGFYAWYRHQLTRTNGHWTILRSY